MSDPRFDPPPASADKPPRVLRPKDAATLILVRRDGPRPRILMGQRSKGHVFMADKRGRAMGLKRRTLRRMPATEVRSL